MTYSCNGKCKDQPNKSCATPTSLENKRCRICKKMFPGFSGKFCPCCNYRLSWKSRVYGYRRMVEVVRI